MLDIKYIRENVETIKEAAKNKNIKIDLNKLLELDERKRSLQTEVDELRAKKNELAKSAKGQRPTEDQIKEGKSLKDKVTKLEESQKEIDEDYFKLMVRVPTVPSKDTPIGKDDSENLEIETWGDKPKFDFKAKNHIELAEKLDIIDFERGAKVSGYRGYYMKNEGASLQMALMMFALDRLIQKGFVPVIPPTLVREFVLFGTGYFSGKGFDPEVDEIYKIENTTKEADGKDNRENKFLIGTAEPSLLAYYSNEILDKSKLPIKFAGFSPCYRSEIGSYGKDTKGLYRVHEFMKVEQVCLTENDVEKSNEAHEEMVEISKELHKELGIPFRVLQICTGDMSAGKYRMFDLEAWMPGLNRYGETGSASNFLDWQSKRLNVRYDDNGEKKNVHMINNTAVPSPRFIISILENFQQKDGSVIIPQVLRKFMPGGLEIIKPKN